jgi:5-formyltetrahydrofolate cyclo-ligase
MNPANQKRALRTRMRRTRAAIPEEDRARMAEAAEEHLFSIPELAAAGTVMLFYSFGSEIQTSRIVQRLIAGGKRVLLPFLGSGGMEAAQVTAEDELGDTTYGPKEPLDRVAVDPGEVDVVVAPGLAFDRRGHRLGYGGGHYDRYLARLGTHALRVGIGFTAQLVDELPDEPGDQPLDMVVTDTVVLDVRP